VVFISFLSRIRRHTGGKQKPAGMAGGFRKSVFDQLRVKPGRSDGRCHAARLHAAKAISGWVGLTNIVRRMLGELLGAVNEICFGMGMGTLKMGPGPERCPKQ
jgi:hypothetical protein